MRFRRSPTHPQKAMIALMAIALLALLGWLPLELAGVISTAAEDTYSEWVFDLPLWGTIGIVVVHVVVGVAAIGSAWHFLEGWVRRRRQERNSEQ